MIEKILASQKPPMQHGEFKRISVALAQIAGLARKLNVVGPV